MENQQNNTGKLIGAVIAGTVLGAVLGVLFAPDKGSNTRHKITKGAKDMAHDLKKKMKHKAKALRNKAEELEELAEDKIKDLAASVKKNVDGMFQEG